MEPRAARYWLISEILTSSPTPPDDRATHFVSADVVNVIVPDPPVPVRFVPAPLKTVPVIEKYKQQHTVIKINGMGTFDEVLERIASEIDIAFKHMR